MAKPPPASPDPYGTDEQKLAWCKERAAAESWQHALASMVSDMNKTGIPLNPDLYLLGMGLAVIDGERGVREFIDGITLASVARTENAGA
jgi:hypothetical protein